MSDKKSIRLNKLTKELNVGIDRILAFLVEKGHDGLKPTSKVDDDIYQLLVDQFQASKQTKLEAKIAANKLSMLEEKKAVKEAEKIKTEIPTIDVKPVGNIDLTDKKQKSEAPKQKEKPAKEEVIKAKAETLSKPKITGEKVDLDKLAPKKKNPVATSSEGGVAGKKKRKRLTKKVNQDRFKGDKARKKKSAPIEVDAEAAQKKVRETLAKLQCI